MIISMRRFTYEELLTHLSKDDKIILFTCNSCIKFCEVGGRAHQHDLAEQLRADGYNVIREELVGVQCMVDLVEQRKTEDATKDIFAEATVIIPLACEDGFEVMKHVFSDKKVISVTKTLGIGVISTEDGPLLTTPLRSTGLTRNPMGYPVAEIAEKVGCYPGPYCEPKKP